MKILLLKNNIVDSKYVDLGIAQVKQSLQSIGITPQIDVKITTKQFSTVSFNNLAIGSGSQVNPNQILDETPIGYDFAFLIFDNTKVGTPVPLNPTMTPILRNGCVPLQMCIQWFGNFPEVFTSYFLNEISHGLFFKFGGNDITHDQQKYPLWQQRQPIDYQLSIIAGFKSKLIPSSPPVMPRDLSQAVVIITRMYDDKQTTGLLVAQKNGATFLCKSLELKYLNNQKNISAIPVGQYQCVWSYSPKFMKYTYEVKNVPSRSGIRIHSGNYAFKFMGSADILGCILLGNALKDINSDYVPDIINSRLTISAFNVFMQKAPFTLIIK